MELQEIKRKSIQTKNYELWKANASMRLHISIGALLDAVDAEEINLAAFAARRDVIALGQVEADTSYRVFGIPVAVKIGMLDGNLIVIIDEQGPDLVGAWFGSKGAVSLDPARGWRNTN